MDSRTHILKFGGSSVATADRIQSVMEIITDKTRTCSSVAVVVSAFAGVTDHLIALGKTAAEGKGDYHKALEELKRRHVEVAKDLVNEAKFDFVFQTIDERFHELGDVLQGIFLVKELSLKTLDLIMSFGERLSAFLIAEALKEKGLPAVFVDARDIIKTDRSFGSGRVHFRETYVKIESGLHDKKTIPIITGFIASSEKNETTTLGRGGSDYTAAIVGAAIGADVIEIWTDVDGVMTADPRKEPYAFPIAEMSFKEALEMSHFGAKVLHPPTIIPALEKKIPLLIKNSFKPEAPGTLISEAASNETLPICGISSIDHVVLVRLQGSGMVGVCGIAKRLFGALAENGINVILISQGSSEHSICFAISPGSVEAAKEAVRKEFALEMQAHIIEELGVEAGLSVIAVVGENMGRNTRVLGKLFEALGKNGIRVSAIAQGSSALNVSAVVKKEDEVKAIRVIHESFFLSPKTTINVFLVGTGLVGGTLLSQMWQQAEFLKKMSLDIRVIGMANSKTMLFHKEGIALDSWKEALEQSPDKTEMKAFLDRMHRLNLINSVFVDCTSSDTVADAYEDILGANISIVTPNKKANSGRYSKYLELKDVAAKKGAKFFYGANVGAGLPVISTINDLVRSGDKISKIEAVLSGTLSYIFNSFREGTLFSQVVRDAQKKGFTEPDPREDLNGMDVFRKILILARESGYPLEMEDIEVEEFLPLECFEAATTEAFFQKLQERDAVFTKMREEAEKNKKKLRYIAKLENGRGSVGLKAVGQDHPFYDLSGSDNIIAITSDFYQSTPLVIKGQGAGATVTAGRVFADIIRLFAKPLS